MSAASGDHVRLRPIRPDEIDVLWEGRKTGDDGSVPGDGPTRERLRDRVENPQTLAEHGRLDLGVEAGGRLIGTVDIRAPKNASPPGVFEIGIGLFRGERGRGYGRDAVLALTDLLFREHDAHRVQGSTALDNHAMRRVFELCGYRFEGVLRAFMPALGGGRDDYALYAITRADWESTPGSPAAAG